MAKAVVAKDWTGLLTEGPDGRFYSDPDKVPTSGDEVTYSNFPLTINFPKAVGDAGVGLHANNRAYVCHSGMAYNIRVAARGGAYPYKSYELSNAPSGMTINSATGEINWPSPTSASNITVTVTDALDQQVSATWSITEANSRFKFFDSVNGNSDTGDGSINNAYAAFADTYDTSKVAADTICVFRQGAYDIVGIPTQGADATLNLDYNTADGRPIMFMGYPGETATIDFGCTGPEDWVPRFRLIGDHIYVDDLSFTDAAVMAFHLDSAYGSVWRRLNFDGLHAGFDGSNAAFITTKEFDAPDIVVQDVVATNMTSDDSSAFKFYGTFGLLVEDVVISNVADGEVVAVKESNHHFDIRNVTAVDGIAAIGLGGNMGDNQVQHEHTGEFRFCNISSSTTALEMNLNGEAGETYAYRNTLRGAVRLLNTDSEDGPFSLTDNVIVNAEHSASPWPGMTLSGVADQSRYTVENNVTAADDGSLIDESGELQGANLALYRGVAGHMRAA
jgi:hypothetical protein